MTPTGYYVIAVLVAVLSVLARDQYLKYKVKRAELDEAALNGPHPAMPDAKIGHKFSSPAMGAKYDQSIVRKWQQRQNRQAAAKRAKSRKAQEPKQPGNVEPMRTRKAV